MLPGAARPRAPLPQEMLRKPPFVLFLAIAIYAIYRGLVLHTNFDAVCVPIYEQFFGNIGRVAMDGWYGPPLTQYYDNCGGHLVVGLLSAPVFAVFGTSYLALKLIPVVLGLMTLVAIWAIARREFGLRTANLAAIFFAIGPPTLAKYSMLAKGNHFENLFFQLLCLGAFYSLHHAQAGSPQRRKRLVIFGLCAGFCIFFYFGSLVLLSLLVVMHLLVRGVRGAVADLAWILPAAGLGLVPLFWIQLSGGARPASFLGDHFSGEGGATAGSIDRIARLQEFFGDFLPRATCFEDLGPLPGAWADGIYLATFAVAWLCLLLPLVAGLRRSLKSFREPSDLSPAGLEAKRFEELKSLPLVGYLPAFIALYAISRFDFDVYQPPVEVGQFRYLVPHYMFACLVVGLAAVRAIAAGGWRRRVGWGLALVMGGLPLFSLGVIDFSMENTGIGTHYRGYNFSLERNVLQRDSVVDPRTGERGWIMARLTAQLDSFPRREKQESAQGVGFYLASAQALPAAPRASEPRTPGLDLGRAIAPFARDVQIDLARGMGTFLRGPLGAGILPQALARELPRLVAEDHPLLPFVIEGLCMHSDFWLSRKVARRLNLSRRLGDGLPEDLRYAWWRGQGVTAGRLLARGIAADRREVIRILGSASPSGLGDLWYGVGFGWGEELRDFETAPGFLERVPGPQRAPCLRGLGAGLRHRLGSERARAVSQGWSETQSSRDREDLEAGSAWPNYPEPQRLP